MCVVYGQHRRHFKRTHRKRSIINTAYSHNGRHNLPLVGNYENRSRKRFDKLFAKIFAPLLRPLFPRLDKKSDAFQSITMNISANLLGLGNAATPFGLKAMEQLHTLNDRRDIASNEMVVFVVMNTASLQLLPTTLAALRQSYGSSAPFEIIVPVWITSACALTVALLIACTLNIRQGKI